MNRQESVQAARGVATKQLDVTDEEEVETLASDELFAAYSFLHREAGVYQFEVESTAAGDDMVEAAKGANADTFEVLRLRAEELLGRPFARDGGVPSDE